MLMKRNQQTDVKRPAEATACPCSNSTSLVGEERGVFRRLCHRKHEKDQGAQHR